VFGDSAKRELQNLPPSERSLPDKSLIDLCRWQTENCDSLILLEDYVRLLRFAPSVHLLPKGR
jgi:hypothetical protein